MIDCQDVIKIYHDPELNIRVAALRGIDLRISKGEVISIVGPSGSGKSTLIKILAGIESIDSGIAHIGKYELEKMNSKNLLNYRLNNIGMVHQFPERTLFLSGSVMDNLQFSASLHSRNYKENKINNKRILQELNIGHLENRRVAFLSGGEMIRTSIAFMLAKEVPILLCDEPTGQLDTENTNIVKDTLRQIASDFESTVLVVTHDKRFLTGVDRTCSIHDGRVSSLIRANQIGKLEKQEFPLRFQSQVDSSHGIRIPDEIYSTLKIKGAVEFLLTEDSKVEIVNPMGIEPEKIDIKEQFNQKELSSKPLPSSYFADNEVEISLKNVSKIYKTKNVEVKALNEVSIDIRHGEIVFVVGPSGSGKTTFVKLITGMEPVTSGEITVLNNNLHTMTDSERARFRRENIGIVSQQGDLHPFLTVTENLFLKQVLSLKNTELDSKLKEEIQEIFTELEIDHRQHAYPLDISGGELQRASLALAQFDSPPILIMDEPTANMDGDLAMKVMNKVFETHKLLDNTLIITTHDTSLVKDDFRLIELIDGKTSKNGLAKTEEIKN